jgi:hypothetical protein
MAIQKGQRVRIAAGEHSGLVWVDGLGIHEKGLIVYVYRNGERRWTRVEDPADFGPALSEVAWPSFTAELLQDGCVRAARYFGPSEG